MIQPIFESPISFFSGCETPPYFMGTLHMGVIFHLGSWPFSAFWSSLLHHSHFTSLCILWEILFFNMKRKSLTQEIEIEFFSCKEHNKLGSFWERWLHENMDDKVQFSCCLAQGVLRHSLTAAFVNTPLEVLYFAYLWCSTRQNAA